MKARKGDLDVQGRPLEESYILSRVGIKGVKRPITIMRPGKAVALSPTIDVSVDLPAEQKGSHMSRHMEVLKEAIDQALKEENDSLERFVERVAFALLRSHDYARYADVRLSTDYFLERTSPDERKVMENYRLFAEARLIRGSSKAYRSIGVEVSGMSACPCAMENVRELIREEMLEKGADVSLLSMLDEYPAPTHNQKNVVQLEIGASSVLNVDADDLIGLVESQFSAPTFEILKRRGEAKLVLDAHRNPKFVEDIVRDMIHAFLDRYRELPDDAMLHVSSVSLESIHKHDAFAERTATLGELREGTGHQGKAGSKTIIRTDKP
ncbi:MAG: GTP cyclohydrolase MptA [Candidatus Thermoplasmatota archaeon]|nr:GTP cyclohydrolase MptA [Candidatus Thermoplasmatota archaeon]